MEKKKKKSVGVIFFPLWQVLIIWPNLHDIISLKIFFCTKSKKYQITISISALRNLNDPRSFVAFKIFLSLRNRSQHETCRKFERFKMFRCLHKNSSRTFLIHSFRLLIFMSTSFYNFCELRWTAALPHSTSPTKSMKSPAKKFKIQLQAMKIFTAKRTINLAPSNME